MVIIKNIKYLSLGLATAIAFSPIVNATSITDLNKQTENYIEVINEMEQEKITESYIEHKGEVVNINRDGGSNHMMITVASDKGDFLSEVAFHISEDTLIVDGETKESIDRDELKESDILTVFYNKNNAMTMSLPPQTVPDAIVVNSTNEESTVKLSHFNDELIDAVNTLKLNISEDAIIVDTNNNVVGKEELANKDLMVFYSASTRSIPAQTSPDKVILLGSVGESQEIVEEITEEIEDMSSFNSLIINEKSFSLENSIYKSDNTYMIPLREIAEELGYEVIWNNDEKSIEIIKDNQWSKVTIGEDNYNFAKMLVRLGKAPEIAYSKTFVPVSFLEEVLNLEIAVSEGMLEIK